MSRAKASPSARSPFIFQLPAISFLRSAMSLPGVRRSRGCRAACRTLSSPATITPALGRVNPRPDDRLGKNRNGRHMLQAIRTRAGGIIVKVLFGLLIISFGFWGLYTRSPFFQDKSPEAVVASVGDRDIHADAVQAALQPALERLRAQPFQRRLQRRLHRVGVDIAVADRGDHRLGGFVLE